MAETDGDLSGARLVLDWDGTVTQRDSLWMVLERFGDREVFARVEEELLRGEIPYREVMEVEMATVRARVDEVAAYLLRAVRIRPGFHELAERHRPLVLSSGFVELIDPLLAREGVDLEVAANRLEPGPDGWRIRWRDTTACEHCGDACKRGGLPPGPVVFVGDGYSDRCAARAAARVFARDGLAEYLRAEGVPFEPFDDLHDVAAALAAG
jgi:2-hydroxy-3-keto-5-methylthiopentenyl-1-phosphate phosphatase